MARFRPQNMRVYQLRQELVLTAARHDAALAYQLLAATKPPANMQPTTDARGPRPQMNSEENLEQILLGRIAALDPKLAAQNAEQMMDKGQFPTTLPQVINQLYKQDPDAAEKLADKTVKKIQAANILSSPKQARSFKDLSKGRAASCQRRQERCKCEHTEQFMARSAGTNRLCRSSICCCRRSFESNTCNAKQSTWCWPMREEAAQVR